jgi:hypothetical protein
MNGCAASARARLAPEISRRSRSSDAAKIRPRASSLAMLTCKVSPGSDTFQWYVWSMPMKGDTWKALAARKRSVRPSPASSSRDST